ncbi:hypothetical protein VNI00_017470 [Paramarasmius palmivorus]|uniref:Uncharacterized protein n=1 Tax=Paramarasmius palmivorus TaxID=297713 RepID=A0AAW0B5D5_9AGAR
MDWLYTPSAEGQNERDEDSSGTSQGPIQIHDGYRGEQRAKQEHDSVESEEKFEASDELLTLRVPKAVFDKAAVELVADLRKELRAAKDLLFKKDAQIEELHNELNDAKASIADLQGAAEDLETNTTTERLMSEIKRLPMFDALPKQRNKLKRVLFIDMDLCREMGWERFFQERFQETYNSASNNSFGGNRTMHKLLYTPGRTFFFYKNHALTIGPKTQTNVEHDFELLSPFDDMYDQRRELFFDKTTLSGHNHKKDIFYGGTYQVVGLKDLHPQGERGLGCIVDAIADAQTQKPPLGKSKIKELVLSGDIKLELVGLQCVGFDEDLYQRVTDTSNQAEPAKSAGKRKQPAAQGGVGGSHPRGKRRKKD